MLPPDFRRSLREELLRFLWRQWSQLGVAGKTAFEDSWIIDAETLLLATLHLGRFDPRLFDEVLDWAIRNASWISVQRLKNLIQKQSALAPDVAWAAAPPETLSKTLVAFATVIDAHDATVRWKTLMRGQSRTGDESRPFFLDLNGDPLPAFGKTDPYFLAVGWERSPFERRALSTAPPMDTRPCLLLKLRSLFGLSPRAEVISYLLTHSAAGAREIARATAYSPTSTHYALTELAAGQFLYTSSRRSYQIDGPRWAAFLDVSAPPPKWVDWQRVFAALMLIVDALDALEAPTLSSYLRASRMLRLCETLSEILFDCGVQHPFTTPCRIEDVSETLPTRIRQFVASLNQEGKPTNLPEQ
jgi:hypothetical protein